MIFYTPMQCSCGRTIEPEIPFIDRPKKASSWESCVFKCQCGLAYSNSKTPSQRRRIVRTPSQNIPAEVASELDLVLSKALNITCQKSKRAKFCSESSEDAVTWTVFRYLSGIRGLSILAEAVNAQADPVASPAMLLWGAPSCRSSKEYEILSELITQLDFLGEDSKRRTEPDVIVAWPNLLIIVEAKYLGGNVRQTNYQHFDRYLGDDSEFFNTPSVDIKRAGYYELVRNWRVGVGLADERNFIFVNLGIPKFISRDCSVFAKQVRQSERRRFAELSWRDLLTRIKYPALWFQKFVQDKGLI